MVTKDGVRQDKQDGDRQEVAMERAPGAYQYITKEDKRFLNMVKNNRAILLDHLQSLGLLSSFLEAESGTRQEP